MDSSVSARIWHSISYALKARKPSCLSRSHSRASSARGQYAACAPANSPSNTTPAPLACKGSTLRLKASSRNAASRYPFAGSWKTPLSIGLSAQSVAKIALVMMVPSRNAFSRLRVCNCLVRKRPFQSTQPTDTCDKPRASTVATMRAISSVFMPETARMADAGDTHVSEKILPGFNIPLGSNVCFSCRISAISAGSRLSCR
jgi:hypothetical protein